MANDLIVPAPEADGPSGVALRHGGPAGRGSLLYVSVPSTVRREPSRSTATIRVSLGLSRSAWTCAACVVLNVSGAMVPPGPTRLTARQLAPVLPSPGAGWRSSIS